MYSMVMGYAYEGDEWELVVYTPNGKERFLELEYIDGRECVVFLCPDGVKRAQSVQYCYH